MPRATGAASVRLTMGQELPTARISLTCGATPETVYDVLADLRTHFEWGGAMQTKKIKRGIG